MKTQKTRTTIYIDTSLKEKLKGQNLSKLVNNLLRQHLLYLRVAKLDEFTEAKCWRCKKQYKLLDLKKVEYASGIVKRTCQNCIDREKAKGSFSTIIKVLKT